MKIILLIIILAANFFAIDDKKNQSTEADEEKLKFKINYPALKDTLFTTLDYFLEVDLSKQTAYLHSRYDSLKTFGVSTGTSKIKEGIETKQGVFAIQFKAEKWRSVQFDSTLMLHFMTFNWGVGFHALAGNSYYKYLGVKRSSHGCVRVSREDAKDIFSKVDFGTPVIVHNGNPAVYIGFADKNDPDLQYLEYQDLKNLVSDRIGNLYKGEYLLKPNKKLLIDNKNLTHAGIPVGDGTKINPRQILKPDYLFIEEVNSEIKNIYNFNRAGFTDTSNYRIASPFPEILNIDSSE